MNTCVVGLQWGDEGKGKIVDLLSENAELVVRYSGGANAGHSVVRSKEEKQFALHLLPSGILRPEVTCVITNGVVLDPEILLKEIDGLAERGIKIANNLKISGRAHLVMPYHKKQDQLSENALGKDKIGTTIRGIGPCYADKVTRSTAIRAADLLNLDNLQERLIKITGLKNKIFAAVYGDKEPLDVDILMDLCRQWAKRLTPHLTDTTALLHKAWHEGRSILFEGAQGSLLDLDHGTFPFVTSSNCSAVGLSAACGLPAKAIDTFMGVVKAYTSRVGAGPFPTEQDNETGRYIRDKGHEYGTTTGRPRRCGWFDTVSVGYTIQLGGIDKIAMLHLDTLSGLKELNICTGYRYQGKSLDFFPAEADVLDKVECVYETLPGFTEDISGITSYAALPNAARRYVERVEALLQTPIAIVGVGPSREETLFRN
ncbi:MAG: adenylosuccinate synthase [Sedimentisphaerales bacterium]|nr:adenylosuccinate synthase [Sedimentisphaerales bacterium]